MNWLKKTYRAFVNHLTKTLGVAGAALLGADVTGYLEGIKAAALQYLPPDLALQLGKWLGFTLFVAVIARGWYTGWKSRQKAETLPPPQPSAVVKMILILCAIAIGIIAPRAYATEVAIEKDAPKVDGHPLTSVVVTQCNLIVAVYMTMSDGRLLRFDKAASVPANELMTMAYSATRSERIEVSCNETGEVGHETHEPV